MTYKIKILEEAEFDLEEAYQWYKVQVNQLGSEFIRVVDNHLVSIQKNPLAAPLIYRNVRRKVLPRFPYGLFYVVQDDLILVVACFHVKRDPSQWKRRIG